MLGERQSACQVISASASPVILLLKTENLKLHTYSYNGLGNRETATEGHVTTTYQTNALNQYTAIAKGEREQKSEYDPNGNLIEDENATYIWNANNRLVRVEKNSGIVATYQYDYMGRRTRKTVRQPDGSTTQSEFVYDGWNVIAEFETKTTKHKEQNTKNSAARYYTWGRDLSGTLQGAGGVGGLLSIRIESDDSKGELLYPSYDANGNISEVVDSNGMVRAAFQYGPFGNLISGSGDLAEEIPFRFSTKYFDDETGFNYYGFRYYVPEIGRWLSRDPIRERGGANLYAFVQNSPTISFDLLGLAVPQDNDLDAQKVCKCLNFYLETEDLNSGRGGIKYKLPADGGTIPVKTPKRKLGPIGLGGGADINWMILSEWIESDCCKSVRGKGAVLQVKLRKIKPDHSNLNDPYKGPGDLVKEDKIGAGGQTVQAVGFEDQRPINHLPAFKMDQLGGIDAPPAIPDELLEYNDRKIKYSINITFQETLCADFTFFLDMSGKPDDLTPGVGQEEHDE